MPHDDFIDLQTLIDGMEPTEELKSSLNIGQLFEAER